jgi:hypothetical protein
MCLNPIKLSLSYLADDQLKKPVHEHTHASKIMKQWKDSTSVGVVPISCIGLVARADEPVVAKFPGTKTRQAFQTPAEVDNSPVLSHS